MPSLAAGNAVILKPSEETPLSVLYFAKLFSEIDGFPKGLFNVVPGYGMLFAFYRIKMFTIIK